MNYNTKKSTNVFIPSIKGAGISCVYNNRLNIQKSFSGIYNDVFMQRLKINDKIKEISKNESYSRITIEEMKSRTYSLILASELRLLSKEEVANSFLYIHKSSKKPHTWPCRGS